MEWHNAQKKVRIPMESNGKQYWQTQAEKLFEGAKPLLTKSLPRQDDSQPALAPVGATGPQDTATDSSAEA